MTLAHNFFVQEFFHIQLCLNPILQIENSNEWVSWIEEAISKNHIKHYKYEYFSNIKEVGSGSFGKVYRANWKTSNRYFALKSFLNLNHITVKEIVNEVIIIKKIVYFRPYNMYCCTFLI